MNNSLNLKKVNLPKTKFPMKGDLAKKEPSILDFWNKLHLYQRLEEKHKSSKKFILHDGPPYANGHIHIGHVVNKVLKDFVIKYRMMTGYYAPFVPGWDCHGLPIEHQLMKEKKLDKHRVNLIDFRIEAANFAEKFINIQRTEFIRLGVIGDWDHPYLTMDRNYEKVIVQCFHELLAKGFIYRKKKPVLWCAECETALAEAEVEYDNHTSPSIYVAFSIIKEDRALSIESLKKFEKINLVIWTTTPWTLPANAAVALKPGRSYVFLKKDNDAERYLIEQTIWKTQKDILALKLGLSEVENDPEPLSAEMLKGLRCRHPFITDRKSNIILADFVDVETGSGAVHIAPGHGVEDYTAGLAFNLPIISPVDNEGKFTDEVPLFKGKGVFESNKPINELLGIKGALLFEEKIQHSYPHCWRCKNPVIFRATEQWFLSVDHQNLRKRILELIPAVEWVPHYGEGRIRGMIESRPDWCLSRQRLWGTPITIIFCSACSQALIDARIMKKIEDRIAQEGSNIWFTAPVLSFMYPDAQCPHCKGKEFRKETDILDVWFDSGVSHEAVLKQDPRFYWPADLYLEGSDQHRGWFQTSIIPAVALRGKPPYNAVLTHGFTVDGEGKKMSKSSGNVVAPEEIIKTYGADMLRAWVAASDYREDIRISPEIVKLLVDVYRRIRNTLRFLLGNIQDFSPSKDRVSYEDLLEIDKWALHALQKLIEEVKTAYNSYEFHKVWRNLNTFCSVTMSASYFDILKDRLYTWSLAGKERRSAQTVLLDIFLALERLIAPIMSFTAEEAWQVFKEAYPDFGIEESVLLADMPEVRDEYISDRIGSNWKKLYVIREKVTAELEKARQKGAIKSSLEAEVIYETNNSQEQEILSQYTGSLDMICIVSKMTVKNSNVSESITVRKAPGTKCERCWRWQEDVSPETMLCGRCRTVTGITP
ncbi:MAG: isoleucine--tRNA ligase [bacterium]